MSARLRESAERSAASLPAVLQIAAAATAAYAFSFSVLGHAAPIFAAAVAINSLGFSRDARPVRVAESALAITLGIVLADLLLLGIGRGWWQLFVVLVVTFAVARLLSASPGFAAAAGVQSSLVTLFPATGGEELGRAIDGVVGGVVALLFTALVPRDPLREVLREAHRVFAECTDAVVDIAAALRTGDEPTAGRALERLRTTQPLLDAWAGSLETAIAVSRVSPFLWRRRRALAEQRRIHRGMDLASRNLRVIARRVDFLVRDGVRRPELGALMAEISSAIALLAATIDDPSSAQAVRDRLVVLAPRLDPAQLAEGASVADGTIVILLRTLTVDLLGAAGMDEDDARELLPGLSPPAG
ncbi:aromatic acid exporter family protein [Herbiconiux sp. L3-i23]|uniref:FUSC family protein n=1 Tax=Herbiconiux sp. L3-i23 TaxID=2905871 RepID=UPI00205D252B|nr:FUSC family protein [Herbiconiux sp. L3-i23]BDI23747.1 FUSC family protein [Herbiconiux sp. L3-i23]